MLTTATHIDRPRKLRIIWHSNWLASHLAYEQVSARMPELRTWTCTKPWERTLEVHAGPTEICSRICWACSGA